MYHNFFVMPIKLYNKIMILFCESSKINKLNRKADCVGRFKPEISLY